MQRSPANHPGVLSGGVVGEMVIKAAARSIGFTSLYLPRILGFLTVLAVSGSSRSWNGIESFASFNDLGMYRRVLEYCSLGLE